jgi:site-specific DNA-methyltransferase (adenine-specific)
VLRYGTGALNISACRILTEDELRGSGGAPLQFGGQNSRPFHSRAGEASADNRYPDSGATNFAMAPGPRGGDVDGRWPANLIHDGSEPVVALFPEEAGQAAPLKTRNSDETRNTFGDFAGTVDANFAPHDGLGSAARFFYCAKASKTDRNEGTEHLPQRLAGMVSNTSGQHITRRDDAYEAQPQANHHPTVKPTELMAYLCRLVTPPGGLVLDPFMGSGSTGKACMREGFRFIGIDRDADEQGQPLGYIDIARARIEFELNRARMPRDARRRLNQQRTHDTQQAEQADLFTMHT